MRPGEHPRVPPVPAVRSGVGSGDADAAAGRGGARPVPGARHSRDRGSSRARHQDAGAFDRSPPARQMTTRFVLRRCATFLCYAFVLRLCATSLVLPQISIQLPFTNLSDVLLPFLALRVQIPLVDVLAQRDRKSTRLNSSHGYISYAVFCLKKKKKNTEITAVLA